MSPTPPNLQAMREGKNWPDDPGESNPRRPLFRRLGPDWAFYLVIAVVIAVLAMIPVPGFIDGHTRSRAAVTMRRLRSIESALEKYHSDHGVFPQRGLCALTTPVAYIDRLDSDFFSPERGAPLRYHTNGQAFIIGSLGPDGSKETDGDLPWHDAEAMNVLLKAALINSKSTLWQMSQVGPGKGAFTYDPSNGTFSEGDIWRVGGRDGGATP